MEYKYTGIILDKRDIGETDRIYDIYTLEQGKVSAIARGVRKPQAKLAGHLENFCLVDLTIMKNKGLGNISGSIVENNFANLRQNLGGLEKVFSTIKLFKRLVNNEEKDDKIFYLLLDYLNIVNEKKKLRENDCHIRQELISQGFVFKLLDLLGYKIEVNKCVKCGNKLFAEKNFFDYSLGGITCFGCSQKSNTRMLINNNAIKIIRIFFQHNLRTLEKLKISSRDAKELKKISQTFIKWTAI